MAVGRVKFLISVAWHRQAKFLWVFWGAIAYISRFTYHAIDNNNKNWKTTVLLLLPSTSLQAYIPRSNRAITPCLVLYDSDQSLQHVIEFQLRKNAILILPPIQQKNVPPLYEKTHRKYYIINERKCSHLLFPFPRIHTAIYNWLSAQPRESKIWCSVIILICIEGKGSKAICLKVQLGQ